MPHRLIVAILRAEGAMVLFIAMTAYYYLGFSWWFFAVIFFTFDVSMIGYVLNAKIGAIAYNIVHSYFVALACIGVGYFASYSEAISFGIIWMAHIGFDRMLGYGLKLESFKQTHLGSIDNAI